jgi:hypothetical protein
MRKTIQDILAVAQATVCRTWLADLHSQAVLSGIAPAVTSHDTPALFDWLIDAVSYQGIADAIATRYMDDHGRVRFHDLAVTLAAHPTCPRLASYWHFEDCRFAKTVYTCSEPVQIRGCPLPRHDLRNGHLNQTAYSLFLFIRDVCAGDLVNWIDQRLATADQTGAPDRPMRMRQALLEPLGCIYGVSGKVLSMAFSELLLGADSDRDRWVTTGASMVAVDTLVHNWLHRTGSLQRLGAEHSCGPGCYRPGGCASIIENAAQHIDARQFCSDGPAFFPRLLQKGIWMFCAQLGLDICNGNRIDDRHPCEQLDCPLFEGCERVPLRPVDQLHS